MAASLRSLWWLVSLPMLAATVGCIPDVNVTGIRGEGGSGTGANGTGASGTGGVGTGATGTGGSGTGAGGTGASGGTGGEPIEVLYRNNGPDPEPHQGADDCITVECPGEYNVLSGGGAWDGGGLAGDPLKIVLTASHVSGQNEWEICGRSMPPHGHSWYPEALCGSFFTEIAQESGTHSGAGLDCITATCGAGTKAVGGGGAWTATADPPEIRLTSSRPTDAGDGWTICGVSNTSSHEWTVQAVCADVATEIVQSVPVKAGDNTSTCIEKTCPVGKVATGGGGSWDIYDGVTNHAQRPKVNMLGPNGWVMCADTATVDVNQEWFVEVVCL